MKEKDIKFSEKKVDESWKEHAQRDRSAAAPKPSGGGPSARKETSPAFLNFMNSLAVQVMIHLGEVPHPESRKTEINLEAAREIIDLLVQLKSKTEGNLSDDEASFFSAVLPELQMKFAQRT